MSAITPQTELRLIKCPIESDNRNQLTFASKTAQYNYFNSLPHLTVDNFTYQRKDNIIRYPAHIDSIITYNYVMYQNEAYTNKWFYAFITNMEYVNDNMTLITIKTDVYQTWAFDLVWKQSFIEREHVNSDNYGEHTIPENLETGDYVQIYGTDYNFTGTSHIVMASNVSPYDGTTAVSGDEYGGIYSGVCYYVFQNTNKLKQALETIATEGNSNSIVSLFYCPDFITKYSTAQWNNGIAEVPNDSSIKSSTSIGIPLTPGRLAGGYEPINKKLFSYPYVAYVLSNNAGDSYTYHLEDFYNDGTNSGTIEIWGSCTPGCSIRAIPKYYKALDDVLPSEYNNEYGLNAGKLPVCSWANDTYTNWLTQQSVNFFGTKLSYEDWATIGGTASAGLGALKLYGGDSSGASDIINGFGGIFNVMQQEYQHSFNSMVAQGNVNSGDVTFSIGKLCFSGYLMSIKPEYARVIDKYFSMYGYKVNTVKMPNITGRTNWNYVKTIGANIQGDVPEDHLNEIKSLFNNGITLWHNPTTYLDYSQSNAIV